MSTRSFLIVASLLAAVSLGACQSRYSDVYSFKKNSFKPPVAKRTEFVAPTAVNPLQTQPGGLPGTTPGGDIPGIPGVPGGAPAPAPAPTGIPGLDAPPAPAPPAP